MLYRISRFGISQTSKVAGVVYFVIGILLIPLFFLGMLAPQEAGTAPTPKMNPLVLLLLPFLYGLIGWGMTALGLYIYNATAKRIGGVEMDIVYATEPPPDGATTL
jgi:hypothetical protein